MNATEHLKAVVESKKWIIDHGTWYECKFCFAIDALHDGEDRIRHRENCEIGNAIKFLQEQGEI